VWVGVPAGCQWPKCRKRVGFEDPAGSTWRGTGAGGRVSLAGAVLGKNGDDQLRAELPAGDAAGAARSPWRTEVIGAVKTRSAPSPSTGHVASRPASLMERDTSNSSPQERQQNA
jgi:hypothetical protein